jgi:hypothetical protein
LARSKPLSDVFYRKCTAHKFGFVVETARYFGDDPAQVEKFLFTGLQRGDKGQF